MQITVGKCTIDIEDSPSVYFGKPMDDSQGVEGEQPGQATIFRVTTSDELDLQYAIVSWPNANREVCFFDWFDGDTKYENLSKGTGRLAISTAGENEVFQLRAMKYNKASKKANLAGVSLEKLSEWAQTDIIALLKEYGAIEVGTKEQLIGEDNKTKNILSVLIPKGNNIAVAVAFTVTRVLAIMHDYGLEEN